jgi:hypothetical protein
VALEVNNQRSRDAACTCGRWRDVLSIQMESRTVPVIGQGAAVGEQGMHGQKAESQLLDLLRGEDVEEV